MKCRFLKPNIKHEVLSLNTVRTLSKYGVFSGPYFPDLGVNTEIYVVNLRLQSEYGKIRTRKSTVFGHFLRSGIFLNFKL